MAPRWRRDRHIEADPGVDEALRAAAGEVLRDEEEALEAEPAQEVAVLRDLTDFVLRDFIPWTSTEADRLSGVRSGADARREEIERDVEAVYQQRFRSTVSALARELAGRGCLSHPEVVQVREAQTVPQILSLGGVMLGALRRFGAVVADHSTRDAADPRIRSDDGLIALPYEVH